MTELFMNEDLVNRQRELAGKLDTKYPILRKFIPPDFVDFRKGIPPDYCGGLMIRIPDIGADESTPVQFKCKFGSLLPAKTAVDVLEAFGISAKVISPHVETLESESETYRIRNDFWTVAFDLPLDYCV